MKKVIKKRKKNFIPKVYSDRLRLLPPYLFAELDRQKKEILNAGKDLIDLSVGDPDLPPPKFLVEELKKALEDPTVYRYPPYQGIPEFRQAISRWYENKFNIKIDPETEVWSLIGSKEGLVHLTLAVVNPGDIVLLPDPCFPPYRSGVIFAGGQIYSMPLKKENDFLPNLDSIKPSIANRARLMILNYPNNPTSAIATKQFFQEVVRFATKYGIIVCQDCAYGDIYYQTRPISFLEIPGAKEIGVEARSFTKSFNVAGWRIGWLAGNAEVVQAAGTLKTNLDSGVFIAFQKACAVALDKGDQSIEELRETYRRRKDILVNGLLELDWEIYPPQATFYLWTKIPKRTSSIKFSQHLLNNYYIATIPGIGFGKFGEGYIRFALTIPEERLKEAIDRLKNSGKNMK